MGITLFEQSVMAFIQYFSQAESESLKKSIKSFNKEIPYLVNSFVPKLENYGMIIPIKDLNIQSNYMQNSGILVITTRKLIS